MLKCALVHHVDKHVTMFFNYAYVLFQLQLPAIEHVVKLPSPARDGKCPPIYVLVICPTRELATQASAEAKKLLKYHPSIGVQVVIGGTRLTLEQKRMQANPCQVSSLESLLTCWI